ncbi:caspase family protein [Arthrobacter sp. ok362]|uniref:caspase family protein n=1 Tax=Arthrobacter sp. ok362 TaxID=1761745 RepID=UPI000891041F|nr:caspase family protein [Arthrobacter sp. ok362]SDK59412.1 Caspase domain-containing protein [Arthrobacter sp. ok362]
MANRALLVGIDVYPDPRNNLNSCIADTLAFRQMLQNTYGFDLGSIKLLHNQDATKANVLASLDAMLAGAQPEDRLVFFESSHGYRYPKGDTMVEVLCLYDQFLEDTEFVAKSQSVPPDVLTACIDACHSGGLNKLFFADGNVNIAPAKVWKPTAEEEAANLGLYSQVTKFKFFGYASTADSGAVAKNFAMGPIGVDGPKNFGEGAPEFNGALFAACQADQTAAAGSLPTNYLSAFTYALLQELDPRISLSDLNAKVVARLKALNMNQAPQAVAPTLHQEILTDTFVSMQKLGDSAGPQSPASEPSTNGFDPLAYLRDQLASLRG